MIISIAYDYVSLEVTNKELVDKYNDLNEKYIILQNDYIIQDNHLRWSWELHGMTTEEREDLIKSIITNTDSLI